jgi:hypothetical protein
LIIQIWLRCYVKTICTEGTFGGRITPDATAICIWGACGSTKSRTQWHPLSTKGWLRREQDPIGPLASYLINFASPVGLWAMAGARAIIGDGTNHAKRIADVRKRSVYDRFSIKWYL